MMVMSARATDAKRDVDTSSASPAAVAAPSKPGSNKPELTGMESARADRATPKRRFSNRLREAQPVSSLWFAPVALLVVVVSYDRVAKYGPSAKYPKKTDPHRKGAAGRRGFCPRLGASSVARTAGTTVKQFQTRNQSWLIPSGRGKGCDTRVVSMAVSASELATPGANCVAKTTRAIQTASATQFRACNWNSSGGNDGSSCSCSSATPSASFVANGLFLAFNVNGYGNVKASTFFSVIVPFFFFLVIAHFLRLAACCVYR
mmetsp:Transcript_3137/g.5529  ORF Transcript_3137/g.5529 Transcript_3137/m.5529 type:complete len:261 (+) Transcript_3137:208-990(+)